MASVSVNTAVKTIELFGSSYDAAAREDIATLTARKVETAGLATGGGDLSADRVITVAKATGADAMAGTDDTLAVTPLALATPLEAIWDQLALLAPLDSPVFTGRPEVPQAPLGTADDQVANTAFVAAALADLDAGADLAAHLADLANPHQVAKAQVGLSEVANLAPADLPVSNATQAAINAVAADADTADAAIAAHVADMSNPHQVDAADIGLGDVANLAPADLPVSDATQLAINAVAADTVTVAADLAAHVADTVNPHQVDAADVGLGDVANLAPADLPVSDATQAAINAVAASVASVDDTVAYHLLDVFNPHQVDAADVGLGDVANLAPADLPISDATQAAINAVAADADAAEATIAADLAAHVANTGNPHQVDAADVGLSDVANLAPADLPISDATADAIADLQTDLDAVQAEVDALPGLIAAPSERPGDAPALYGQSKTGTAASIAPVDPTWVATSAAGSVLRVNGAVAADPQVVAPLTASALQPDVLYQVTFRVQRQVNPADPLNDSVSCGIRWLNQTQDGLAGAAGQTVLDDIALTIADGVQTRTATLSTAAGIATVIAPAGAVYFRAYVELFGGDHVTDVIVIAVAVDVLTALRSEVYFPAYAVLVPVSGATLAVPATRKTILNPAAALAALTLTLPAAVDKQTVRIATRQRIDLLTVTAPAGITVDWPANELPRHGVLDLTLVAALNAWVRG